ncbi:hypothetical protein OVW19_28100, partial [Klebsiella pneumoniae]|uniref:lipid II flippase MurJ n=1 Tax=Klebsiella pneumoniae TaxID=573 RepID=UPI00226D5405
MPTPLGHVGLALASSIGAWVNVGALVIAARRRFGRLGGRVILASVVRTTLASVPLTLWCVAMLYVWPARAGTAHEVLWDVLWLGGTIAGGA